MQLAAQTRSTKHRLAASVIVVLKTHTWRIAWLMSHEGTDGRGSLVPRRCAHRDFGASGRRRLLPADPSAYAPLALSLCRDVRAVAEEFIKRMLDKVESSRPTADAVGHRALACRSSSDRVEGLGSIFVQHIFFEQAMRALLSRSAIDVVDVWESYTCQTLS